MASSTASSPRCRCPDDAHRVARMFPVPTARFVAVTACLAVVVLVLPVAVPWGFVAGCLLAVAVVDTAAAADPSVVGVDRQLTSTVTLGGDGEVRWRVTNPTARRIRVAVADELAPSLGAGRRRFALTLPPGASLTERTELHPSRRGRFEPDDVVVRVEGPLGLMARQRTRALRTPMRVLPPFRSRTQVELRIARAQLLEIGLRTARGTGGGRS